MLRAICNLIKFLKFHPKLLRQSNVNFRRLNVHELTLYEITENSNNLFSKIKYDISRNYR